MKMMIRFRFSLAILGIGLLLSCKKEKSPEELPASPLFTITFSNGYISRDLPVILFLSLPDGTTLLDTTCHQNGTYILYLPAGKPVPELFSVTLVRPSPYWHSFFVEISTYSEIERGSRWGVTGSETDTVGTSYVSLTNVPALTGPILYSTGGFYNLTMQQENRSIPLRNDPADLYVKIHTSQGVFYRFDAGALRANAPVVTDMSSAMPATTHPVALPGQCENYSAMLMGFKGNGYQPATAMMADLVLTDGFMTDTILLHYPPARFDGFYSEFMVEEQFNSGVSYHYNTQGPIPSQFLKTDATITAVQPGTDGVTFSVIGTFDMITAQWDFIDKANIIYSWKCHASDTARKIMLPDVSPAFLQWFPTISHDSLAFSWIGLTKLHTLDTYQSLLDRMFDPDSPGFINQFDASSVRKTGISGHSKKTN